MENPIVSASKTTDSPTSDGHGDAVMGTSLPRWIGTAAFLLVSTAMGAGAETFTLVPANATWRFDDTGTDLGTAWEEPSFADTAWGEGPAPLGYGETVATTVSFGGDPANKHITTYFRITFTLTEDPATLTGLELQANFDDGFVAHLNGAQVARREMPGGPALFTTPAESHESGTFEPMNLNAALPFLVQGSNTVAVEVHQADATSSDLFWDMTLVASNDEVGDVLVADGSSWRYEDTGTDLGTSWRDPEFDDADWSAGPGFLGYGDSFIDTEISFGPDILDKYPTAYFRHFFVAPADIGTAASMMLRANFDDGIVVYINGQEVAREYMPEGPITYDTYASEGHGGADDELIDLTAALPLLTPGPNTLAVEVHQVQGASDDINWDAQLELGGGPAVTRGPYLQVGTDSSVVVRWRTDVPTVGRVRFGPDPDQLDQTVLEQSSTTEHEVEVSGLSAATRYYYAIGTETGDIAGGDADHYFQTHPIPGTLARFRTWVIGDCGEANQNARDVRDAYLSYTGGEPTDVWLMTGDNAGDDGDDAEYQAAVFDMYPTILQNTILWPARGNHDRLHVNPNYFDFFTMPTGGEAGGVPSGTQSYYSFDFANVHFVCLDSEGSSLSATGPMATWLTQDLAATTQDWIIAYWHHPPYSKGSHDSDDPIDSGGRMRDMRENFLPILEAAGVDLVLSGHSHSYERSFLLDEHYGLSGTLDPSMILDGGDGSTTGDGAYQKATLGTAPHEGTIYAVAGCASKVSGGALNHPIMVRSLNELGSLVLEVSVNRLDAVFIDENANVRDDFTIIKGPLVATGQTPSTGSSDLRVPNPVQFRVPIRFVTSADGDVSIAAYDISGRRIRTIAEGQRGAGSHEVTWELDGAGGGRVAPGVYFVVIQTVDGVRARRVVVAR